MISFMVVILLLLSTCNQPTPNSAPAPKSTPRSSYADSLTFRGMTFAHEGYDGQ